MVKILFLGEIIGIPIIKSLRKVIIELKKEYNIDFVIANGDGASDGYGILGETAYHLHNYGINVITSGDYIFNKKDIKDVLSNSNFILRPYNLPVKNIGKGVFIYTIRDNIQIGVINLLGRINFNKIFANDPFYSIDRLLEKLQNIKIIILDFHGGATSEIQAMHWYLAGKISAVIGTHLRVLTADYRILNNKTAVITSNGFCGGANTIFGLSVETEIPKIKTGQFLYSKVAKENFIVQGIIMEIDENTGNALFIDIINKKIY